MLLNNNLENARAGSSLLGKEQIGTRRKANQMLIQQANLLNINFFQLKKLLYAEEKIVHPLHQRLLRVKERDQTELESKILVMKGIII